MNILVTGIGGGVGQSIVKSLQDTEHTIIGVDSEVLGAGVYAVAKAYKVPYANAPGYIDKLLEICDKEECDMLFPGLDAELLILSENAKMFQDIGTFVVVSSPDVIKICDDKLRTSWFLLEHGFYAPETWSLTDSAVSYLKFPLVLKPMRGGARSKGVYVVRDFAELSYRLATIDMNNYVKQEYIAGDEYTCGSITINGRCSGTIVMRRILRDGDTYKAFVVADQRIHDYVCAVADALKPLGPCNFQLRMKGDQPYIFEINPRCSGTTYCRALAGFNEPLMTVDYFESGSLPTYKIHEATFLRYWSELMVENIRVDTFREWGVLKNYDGRL